MTLAEDARRRAEADNVWRHFWAGHMAAVGGISRLHLEPIGILHEHWAIPVFGNQAPISVDDQAGTSQPEEVAAQGISAQARARSPRQRQETKSKALAREIGDITVDLLDRIVLAPMEDDDRYRASIGRHEIFAGRRHLVDCDFHLMAGMLEDLDPGGRYAEMFVLSPFDQERELAEMFWPLDMAIAVEKDFDTFFLMRMATLPAREVRGLVKLVPQKILLLASGQAPKTGGWVGESAIVGLINKRWQAIGTDIVTARTSGIAGSTKYLMSTRADPDEIHETVAMTFAMRLTQRYEWHVALGHSLGGTRVVIPTNPRGCLELFSTRDYAPGERRRGALRHWVNEHYRQRSNDSTNLDYVCEHLRGNTRFNWNGLACELMVSAFDLEKNEFFRKRAGEWRAARQHNRVKVRIKAQR